MNRTRRFASLSAILLTCSVLGFTFIAPHVSSTVLTAVQSSGIAFRAAATAGNGTGATSITINKPIGATSGDVLLAGIYVRGHGSVASVTAPTGWTLIRRTNDTINTTTGTIGTILSYYKVAGGAEPNTYTWTFDASRRSLGGIAAYAGVNTRTPIDVSGG